MFSNEAREPLTIFRKAWTITVLKAHGFDTHWRKGSDKDLTHEYQERLRQLDLHWHDLRHEYPSRLVERGVPPAQVRDLLGHASITTTERYDNQTIEALSIAATRLESGKRFDPDQLRVRPSPQPSPRPTSPRLRQASNRGEGDVPAATTVDLLDESTRAGATDPETRSDASTRSTLNTKTPDATQDERNAGVSETDCRILSSFSRSDRRPAGSAIGNDSLDAS